MSDKPKIVCARRFPPDVEARAQASYEAWINEDDKVLSSEQLLELAEGRDALMVSASEKLPGETIARLPESIKAIATFSVGYEHVDVEAARARGIIVTNTPDVLSDCTADIAFLCILGAARRAHEAQTALRKGEWYGWAPTQYMGTKVSGKRLAIFGMGRIGQAVADRGRGFSMEIHYHNRRRLSPEEERGAVFHDTPESLLGVADFLSINAPSTPQTHHFLNAERIEMLPQGAIVVNTARGTLVDDEALIAALKSGRVAAAGLDVFEGEPNVNPAYFPLDNTFLLPHVGSGTIETRNAMGFKCLDNLDAIFAGETPPDPVT